MALEGKQIQGNIERDGKRNFFPHETLSFWQSAFGGDEGEFESVIQFLLNLWPRRTLYLSEY